jgi:hypothetical protein
VEVRVDDHTINTRTSGRDDRIEISVPHPACECGTMNSQYYLYSLIKEDVIQFERLSQQTLG